MAVNRGAEDKGLIKSAFKSIDLHPSSITSATSEYLRLLFLLPRLAGLVSLVMAVLTVAPVCNDSW